MLRRSTCSAAINSRAATDGVDALCTNVGGGGSASLEGLDRSDLKVTLKVFLLRADGGGTAAAASVRQCVNATMATLNTDLLEQLFIAFPPNLCDVSAGCTYEPMNFTYCHIHTGIASTPGCVGSGRNGGICVICTTNVASCRRDAVRQRVGPSCRCCGR